jgi:glucose/arabinose dehydrogenase
VANIKIRLTKVAGLDQPIDFAVRKGTPGYYIAEKSGRIQYLSADDAKPQQVLDITSQVATGGEQGLLGIAFSPDGSTLYVHYTKKADSDGELRAYGLGAGPTKLSGKETVLIDFEDHYANHNGGRIQFGPDGKLYLGLGDGGGGGDPDHHAQDPKALNGKILQFDVGGDTHNPVRYAIGLRNPWRFSFDRANGDLWIGDVGQDAWEEIDRIAAGTKAGVNLGWNLLEGTHLYSAKSDPGGTLPPVYEYNHSRGQAVVGGFVYRGSKVAALRGVYLFTDTYKGNIHGLRLNGGKVEEADLGTTAPDAFVVSFGEDAAGELYVISLNGGVYRIDAG